MMILCIMSIIHILYPNTDGCKFIRTLLLPVDNSIGYTVLIDKGTYTAHKKLIDRDHTRIIPYNETKEIPMLIESLNPLGIIYTMRIDDNLHDPDGIRRIPVYYIHHGFANNPDLYKKVEWKKDRTYIFGDPMMYRLIEKLHGGNTHLMKIPGLPQFDHVMNLKIDKREKGFKVLIATSSREITAAPEKKGLKRVLDTLDNTFGDDLSIVIKHKAPRHKSKYRKILSGYKRMNIRTIDGEPIYNHFDAGLIIVIDYSTVVYEAYMVTRNLIVYQVNDPLKDKHHYIDPKYNLLVSKTNEEFEKQVRMICDNDSYLGSDAYSKGVKNFLTERIGEPLKPVSKIILEEIKKRKQHKKT